MATNEALANAAAVLVLYTAAFAEGSAAAAVDGSAAAAAGSSSSSIVEELAAWLQRLAARRPAEAARVRVVFVSHDRNARSFAATKTALERALAGSAGGQQLLSLPFDSKERQGVWRAVEVFELPTLVFLGADGSVTQTQGRAVLAADPDARGFPWAADFVLPSASTPARIANALKQAAWGCKVVVLWLLTTLAWVLWVLLLRPISDRCSRAGRSLLASAKEGAGALGRRCVDLFWAALKGLVLLPFTLLAWVLSTLWGLACGSRAKKNGQEHGDADQPERTGGGAGGMRSGRERRPEDEDEDEVIV